MIAPGAEIVIDPARPLAAVASVVIDDPGLFITPEVPMEISRALPPLAPEVVILPNVKLPAPRRALDWEPATIKTVPPAAPLLPDVLTALVMIEPGVSAITDPPICPAPEAVAVMVPTDMSLLESPFSPEARSTLPP